MLDVIWRDTLRRLLDRPTIPSRNGPMREIVGYTAEINPDANMVVSPAREASPRYAIGELFWYLHGSRSLSFIKHYAPSYGRFSDDGSTLHGAYGWRMKSLTSANSAILRVIELIRRDSWTRQAVIPIYEAHDSFVTSKDIPCTLSLQFILRDELDCVCTMRSNDVWLGMPYDVFCFTSIQRIIADALGVATGVFYHRAGSMHLYEKNVEAAGHAVDEPNCEDGHNWAPSSSIVPAYSAMAIEQCIRQKIIHNGNNLEHEMFRDFINVLLNEPVKSPLLAKAVALDSR